MRREIDGLNLALYDLSKLSGHLILVHGRSDPMVPYSESQELAAAASRARVSLFLVDDIGHVEFTAVNIRQRLDDVAGRSSPCSASDVIETFAIGSNSGFADDVFQQPGLRRAPGIIPIILKVRIGWS